MDGEEEDEIVSLSPHLPDAVFFGISLACVIVSQVVAYLMSPHWPDTIAACAGLAIGIQWLAFVPSTLLSTEQYFNATGASTYFALALISLLAGGTFYVRQLLVTLLVLLWAVRLGVFLYVRVVRAGKDGRFDEIKHHRAKFFSLWAAQGLGIFLGALPVLCLNSTPQDTASARWSAQWSDYCGMACAGGGLVTEVIADNQKAAFREIPGNEGRWISSGLWAYSRHPNYFGEICFWSGIFLLCSSALSGLQWLSVVSPLFVAVVISQVSGVPVLEARGKQRWGSEVAYQEYLQHTPVLVPRLTSRKASECWSSVPKPTQCARRDVPEGLSESLMEKDTKPKEPCVVAVAEDQ